jgi:hypothetical protein
MANERPFYTPVFDRNWVKNMKEELKKEKDDRELRYIDDPQ